MDLVLNDILASTGTLHEFHDEPGVRREDKRERFSPCHYHGSAGDSSTNYGTRKQWWAAVSTCGGLDGSFSDGKRVFTIKPVEQSGKLPLERPHMITEEEHKSGACGVSKIHPWNGQMNFENLRVNLPKNFHRHGHRQVRQASATTRYLELLIVVDRRAYSSIGGTDAKAKTFVENVANFLDMVYKPLGLRIALTSAIYWKTNDPITISTNTDPTLDNFNRYRRNHWIKDSRYPNDNAQLITGIDFSGSRVGLAEVNAICSLTRSAGVNQHSSGNTFSAVAYTMAHEMGHNLNMNHDDGRSCNNCSSSAKCIMAGATGRTNVNQFSQCATNDLTSLYKQGGGACLDDIPRQFFGTPVCGNGFVETGEQCDCGLPSDCTDPCCNANTCQLSTGSQCSSGPCCSNCRFRPSTYRCRAATGECDISEYCSGVSGNCPTNLVKSSGTACLSGEAYCWDGECRTINEQCQTVWGSHASIGDRRCFDRRNIRGTVFGNCGKVNGEYVACAAADVLCGMLQCGGLNDSSKPITGGSYRSTIATHKITRGNMVIDRFTCRSISIDLGNGLPDLGMALDGIKCGTSKVCENRRCVTLLTATNVQLQQCSPACTGQTVCSNLGVCVDPNAYTSLTTTSMPQTVAATTATAVATTRAASAATTQPAAETTAAPTSASQSVAPSASVAGATAENTAPTVATTHATLDATSHPPAVMTAAPTLASQSVATSASVAKATAENTAPAVATTRATPAATSQSAAGTTAVPTSASQRMATSAFVPGTDADPQSIIDSDNVTAMPSSGQDRSVNGNSIVFVGLGCVILLLSFWM